LDVVNNKNEVHNIQNKLDDHAQVIHVTFATLKAVHMIFSFQGYIRKLCKEELEENYTKAFIAPAFL